MARPCHVEGPCKRRRRDRPPGTRDTIHVAIYKDNEQTRYYKIAEQETRREGDEMTARICYDEKRRYEETKAI